MNEETGLHGLVVKELSFSFRWENLEAIVEWLEAIPEKGHIFATIDTDQLEGIGYQRIRSSLFKISTDSRGVDVQRLGYLSIRPFGDLFGVYTSCFGPIASTDCPRNQTASKFRSYCKSPLGSNCGNALGACWNLEEVRSG